MSKPVHYPVLLNGHHTAQGVITGATTPATMNLSNLLSNTPKSVARFSSLSGMNFFLDFSPNTFTVHYICLLDSNATEDCLLRWRLYDHIPDTTPLLDTQEFFWPVGAELQARNRRDHHLNLLSSPIAGVKHIGCDLTDDDNPDGYLEASRLIIGCSADSIDRIPSMWRPPRGAVRSGVVIEPSIQNSTITYTEGGIPIVRTHPTNTMMTMPIHPVDEPDLPELDNFSRAVGTSKDVVCILNPAIPERLHLHTVHGLLGKVPGWSNAGSPRYQVTPIQVNGFPRE